MTETVDLSPYAEDGVRDHPLSLELRVPLVSSPHTRWNYVTAVVVGGIWEAGEPTDDEMRMIGSYHDEYVSYWYRQSGPWWTKMRARPFDIDGGANGRYLMKHRHGGWGYRHRSWQFGPPFVPAWDAEPEPLLAVLDKARDTGTERWAKWKADHPDIFGGGS